MSKSNQVAQSILNAAVQMGWQIRIRGSVFTIQKHFSPGSREGLPAVSVDIAKY